MAECTPSTPWPTTVSPTVSYAALLPVDPYRVTLDYSPFMLAERKSSGDVYYAVFVEEPQGPSKPRRVMVRLFLADLDVFATLVFAPQSGGTLVTAEASRAPD